MLSLSQRIGDEFNPGVSDEQQHGAEAARFGSSCDGRKTAEFNAVSEAVTTAVSVTITGKAQGVTETDTITLNPVADSPAAPVATLKDVSCGMQSLTGPVTIACSVSLSAAATSQTAVKLSSSSSALKTPESSLWPQVIPRRAST